jgi:thioesterase domain-containing protein
LQAKGETVASLALLDPAAAPTPGARLMKKKKAQLLRWLWRRFERLRAVARKQTQFEGDDAVTKLSKKHGKAERLTRRLREIGAHAEEQSFAEVSDEAIGYALNVLIGALKDYRPSARFVGRISIVSSDERRQYVDGWKETCTECVLYPVPGSHNGVFTDGLPNLVAALRSILGSQQQ